MLSSRRRFLELTAATAACGVSTARAARPEPQWAGLDGIKALAEGFSGPEGPTVLPDEHVLFVARPGNIFDAAEGAAAVTRASNLGTIVGTALDRRAKNVLYVCRMDLSFARRPGMPAVSLGAAPSSAPAAGILRLDLQTNAVTQLYSDGGDGNVLKGPNKLVLDEWGDIWFTDVLAGAVYWARNDGSQIKRMVELPGAHGICLSPDGRIIYIGSDDHLSRLAITGRGALASAVPSFLAPLDPQWRADGIACEANGNVVIACWDQGLIVISPAGELVSQTKIPGFGVTNLAFGGTDARTLYLTVNLSGAAPGETSGKLIALPWPRPGLRLAS